MIVKELIEKLSHFSPDKNIQAEVEFEINDIWSARHSGRNITVYPVKDSVIISGSETKKSRGKR